MCLTLSIQKAIFIKCCILYHKLTKLFHCFHYIKLSESFNALLSQTYSHLLSTQHHLYFYYTFSYNLCHYKYLYFAINLMYIFLVIYPSKKAKYDTNIEKSAEYLMQIKTIAIILISVVICGVLNINNSEDYLVFKSIFLLP